MYILFIPTYATSKAYRYYQYYLGCWLLLGTIVDPRVGTYMEGSIEGPHPRTKYDSWDARPPVSAGNIPPLDLRGGYSEVFLYKNPPAIYFHVFIFCMSIPLQ